jgi:hypothetical protein
MKSKHTAIRINMLQVCFDQYKLSVTLEIYQKKISVFKFQREQSCRYFQVLEVCVTIDGVWIAERIY